MSFWKKAASANVHIYVRTITKVAKIDVVFLISATGKKQEFLRSKKCIPRNILDVRCICLMMTYNFLF